MDGVRPTKEYAGFHEVVRMTCLDTCKGVLAPRICIPLDYPYGKLDHLSADIGRLEMVRLAISDEKCSTPTPE